MKFVKVSVYAEGYYSGQTYEEDIYVTQELFDKIEDWLSGVEVYVYDLDGKHSEVEAEINCEFFSGSAEDFANVSFTFKDDGERLWWRMDEYCEELGLNLGEDYKKVKNFIDEIDSKITVEYQIKKSQKELVDNFVKSLEQ